MDNFLDGLERATEWLDNYYSGCAKDEDYE